MVSTYRVDLVITTDRTSDAVVDLTGYLEHAVVSAGFALAHIGITPAEDTGEPWSSEKLWGTR